MSPLEQILARRAADSSEVYVEGGWVDRVPTVPVDGGVAAVVRFARACWERNLSLQVASLEADRKLAQAEIALRNLVEQGLDKDVAIALAAVRAARTLL